MAEEGPEVVMAEDITGQKMPSEHLTDLHKAGDDKLEFRLEEGGKVMAFLKLGDRFKQLFRRVKTNDSPTSPDSDAKK